MDYLVEHPEVGIIKYFKNNRAKRIIISLKPDYVRVVIPKRQSFKNAQQFVESRLEWIKTNKEKMDSQFEKSKLLPKIDRKVAREVLCRRIGELAPWFSFQKDVILLIVSVVLFINKSAINKIFNTRLTYKLLLVSCLIMFR